MSSTYLPYGMSQYLWCEVTALASVTGLSSSGSWCCTLMALAKDRLQDFGLPSRCHEAFLNVTSLGWHRSLHVGRNDQHVCRASS